MNYIDKFSKLCVSLNHENTKKFEDWSFGQCGEDSW